MGRREGYLARDGIRTLTIQPVAIPTEVFSNILK
jgi:hypothetical protein